MYVSVLLAFRCYNNIINRSCGCRSHFGLLAWASTPTRPVDNVVITTKGLQDRNIHMLDGTTVENKGKCVNRAYIYDNLQFLV